MEPTLYEDLDGQFALVTGANRGIGYQIARGLVDLGADVFAGSATSSTRSPRARPRSNWT